MLPLFIMAIENDTDRQFVAGLYQRHRDFLLRCAQKILNDPDRAEEALHEAMLRVIRSLERVRRSRRGAAALPGHHCADRQHRPLPQNQPGAASRAGPGAGLGREPERHGGYRTSPHPPGAGRAAAGVPENTAQREIDLLNYAYTLELSSKEITRLTGLAPGNVRQILTRARRKVLAAYIEKGGMNHE